MAGLEAKVADLEQKLALAARHGHALLLAKQDLEEHVSSLKGQIEELTTEKLELQASVPPPSDTMTSDDEHRFRRSSLMLSGSGSRRRSSLHPSHAMRGSVMSHSMVMAEEWEQERRELVNQIENLTTDLRAREKQVQEQQGKIEELSTEVSNKRTSLAMATPANVSAGLTWAKISGKIAGERKAQAMAEEVDELRAAKWEIETKLKRLTAEHSQLKGEHSAMESDLVQLHQHAQIWKDSLEQEQIRTGNLEAELQSLTAALDEERMMNRTALPESTSNELKVDSSIGQEFDVLGDGLDLEQMLQEQILDLQDELSHLRNALRQTKKQAVNYVRGMDEQVSFLTEERDGLSKQLEELSLELMALQELLQKARDQDAEARRIEEERDGTIKEMRIFEARGNQDAKAKEELQRLREKARALENALADAKRSAEKYREGARAKRAALAGRTISGLSILNQFQEQLVQAVVDKEQAARNSEELRKKLEGASKSVMALEHMSQELKAVHEETLDFQEEVKCHRELLRTVSTLEQKVAKLKNKSEEREEGGRESGEGEGEGEEKGGPTLEELQQKLQEAKEEEEAQQELLRTRYAALAKRVTQRSEEVQAVNQQILEAYLEKDELYGIVEDLKQRLAKLSSNVDSRDQALRSAKRSSMTMRNQHDGLLQDLEAVHSEANGLKSEMEKARELEVKVAKMEAEYASLLRRISCLQEEEDSAAAEGRKGENSRQQEIDDLQKKLDAMGQSLAETKRLAQAQKGKVESETSAILSRAVGRHKAIAALQSGIIQSVVNEDKSKGEALKYSQKSDEGQKLRQQLEELEAEAAELRGLLDQARERDVDAEKLSALRRDLLQQQAKLEAKPEAERSAQDEQELRRLKERLQQVEKLLQEARSGAAERRSQAEAKREKLRSRRKSGQGSFSLPSTLLEAVLEKDDAVAAAEALRREVKMLQDQNAATLPDGELRKELAACLSVLAELPRRLQSLKDAEADLELARLQDEEAEGPSTKVREAEDKVRSARRNIEVIKEKLPEGRQTGELASILAQALQFLSTASSTPSKPFAATASPVAHRKEIERLAKSLREAELRLREVERSRDSAMEEAERLSLRLREAELKLREMERSRDRAMEVSDAASLSAEEACLSLQRALSRYTEKESLLQQVEISLEEQAEQSRLLQSQLDAAKCKLKATQTSLKRKSETTTKLREAQKQLLTLQDEKKRADDWEKEAKRWAIMRRDLIKTIEDLRIEVGILKRTAATSILSVVHCKHGTMPCAKCGEVMSEKQLFRAVAAARLLENEFVETLENPGKVAPPSPAAGSPRILGRQHHQQQQQEKQQEKQDQQQQQQQQEEKHEKQEKPERQPSRPSRTKKLEEPELADKPERKSEKLGKSGSSDPRRSEGSEKRTSRAEREKEKEKTDKTDKADKGPEKRESHSHSHHHSSHPQPSQSNVRATRRSVTAGRGRWGTSSVERRH